MAARARDDDTLVYTTDPSSPTRNLVEDARRGGSGPPQRSRPPAGREAAPKADGVVRVWLERKGRNGKPVSIVRGLAVDKMKLDDIASRLKRVCGTGGSAKDGEIIIQGDHRARIAVELERNGLRVKLAGG
jgi:translation initiation factor 1